MTNKIQQFTSTGSKLLFHPDFIDSVKQTNLLLPISIQLAPTSICNLSCSFCSNRNRQTNESLLFDAVKFVLDTYNDLGAKTVEITGGGEPTLYHAINETITYANAKGYQVGLITNGTGFGRLSKETIQMLKWIRVSMNVLDYRDGIDIPKLPKALTLGFSYVMNADTRMDEIKITLDRYIKEHKPAYVRIVSDCRTDWKTQQKNNQMLGALIKEWGSPYFYQPKEFHKPNECWWCYVKPFILHDSFVYPCSSIVLNSGSEERFHEKFRWMKIDEIPMAYSGMKQAPFNSRNCDHCVFSAQNALVGSLMHPNGMEMFV